MSDSESFSSSSSSSSSSSDYDPNRYKIVVSRKKKVRKHKNPKPHKIKNSSLIPPPPRTIHEHGNKKSLEKKMGNMRIEDFRKISINPNNGDSSGSDDDDGCNRIQQIDPKSHYPRSEYTHPFIRKSQLTGDEFIIRPLIAQGGAEPIIDHNGESIYQTIDKNENTKVFDTIEDSAGRVFECRMNKISKVPGNPSRSGIDRKFFPEHYQESSLQLSHLQGYDAMKPIQHKKERLAIKRPVEKQDYEIANEIREELMFRAQDEQFLTGGGMGLPFEQIKERKPLEAQEMFSYLQTEQQRFEPETIRDVKEHYHPQHQHAAIFEDNGPTSRKIATSNVFRRYDNPADHVRYNPSIALDEGNVLHSSQQSEKVIQRENVPLLSDDPTMQTVMPVQIQNIQQSYSKTFSGNDLDVKKNNFTLHSESFLINPSGGNGLLMAEQSSSSIIPTLATQETMHGIEKNDQHTVSKINWDFSGNTGVAYGTTQQRLDLINTGKTLDPSFNIDMGSAYQIQQQHQVPQKIGLLDTKRQDGIENNRNVNDLNSLYQSSNNLVPNLQDLNATNKGDNTKQFSLPSQTNIENISNNNFVPLKQDLNATNKGDNTKQFSLPSQTNIENISNNNFVPLKQDLNLTNKGDNTKQFSLPSQTNIENISNNYLVPFYNDLNVTNKGDNTKQFSVPSQSNIENIVNNNFVPLKQDLKFTNKGHDAKQFSLPSQTNIENIANNNFVPNLQDLKFTNKGHDAKQFSLPSQSNIENISNNYFVPNIQDLKFTNKGHQVNSNPVFFNELLLESNTMPTQAIASTHFKTSGENVNQVVKYDMASNNLQSNIMSMNSTLPDTMKGYQVERQANTIPMDLGHIFSQQEMTIQHQYDKLPTITGVDMTNSYQQAIPTVSNLYYESSNVIGNSNYDRVLPNSGITLEQHNRSLLDPNYMFSGLLPSATMDMTPGPAKMQEENIGIAMAMMKPQIAMENSSTHFAHHDFSEFDLLETKKQERAFAPHRTNISQSAMGSEFQAPKNFDLFVTPKTKRSEAEENVKKMRKNINVDNFLDSAPIKPKYVTPSNDELHGMENNSKRMIKSKTRDDFHSREGHVQALNNRLRMSAIHAPHLKSNTRGTPMNQQEFLQTPNNKELLSSPSQQAQSRGFTPNFSLFNKNNTPSSIVNPQTQRMINAKPKSRKSSRGKN